MWILAAILLIAVVLLLTVIVLLLVVIAVSWFVIYVQRDKVNEFRADNEAKKLRIEALQKQGGVKDEKPR